MSSYYADVKETHDADDEEPECFRCDHACDSYEAFCSKCGPKYWWHNYTRTEIRKIEITDELKKRIKAVMSSQSQGSK